VIELHNETGLLQNIDRSNIQRKLIIGTWGTRECLFYAPSCFVLCCGCQWAVQNRISTLSLCDATGPRGGAIVMNERLRDVPFPRNFSNVDRVTGEPARYRNRSAHSQLSSIQMRQASETGPQTPHRL
jgi:hypothetical protein